MDEYRKYLDRVIRFLSYRSRSEKEIRDYLSKKQTPHEIIERIISFLKEQRFLDDEAFVRGWLRQRMTFQHRSLKVIKMELRQKGISQELIEKTIKNLELTIDSEVESLSDLETATRLVKKKLSRYKHLPKAELYQKLGVFLARRGFDWETIRRSIDDVLNLEYNGN